MALRDVYLGTSSDWDALARLLEGASIIGLDTEFYGLDVRKESCVGKARVHVWSLAVRTPRKSPLGFHRARGWVLPAAALAHPGLKAVLEDPSVTKCVHNQPVDDHAIHNHGVQLRGCINTLGLSRWVWPGLVAQGGFGLKNLMQVKLHRQPIAEFKDVVGHEHLINLSDWREVWKTECSCGVEGCRKRKPEGDVRHDKEKVCEKVERIREKTERGQYPLESILPGHERWDLLVRYAAEDAVAALELEELAREETNPAPFPYSDAERPDFNQAIENSVVWMEREGFPVNVPWCTEAAAKAEADELKELAWLRRWYEAQVTAGAELPLLEYEDVDKIWSSPKKLVEMMDDLGFPRSPIWKKGRVKRGDVKTDSTAMQWIATNYPPAAQFVKHYIHLKRIRSGKKYLVKLRDSGGFVHPICGPAGDADDRNGAVTGRLGIKGTLEAAQLPTKEELDLYQVRKAIVAGGDDETLLVADYKALEVVVLGDLCKRLFDNDQLAQSVAPGAPDIHSENAKYTFGTFLGWTIPLVFKVEGKTVMCPYAGQNVNVIPTEEFKTHPYGAFLRDSIKTVFYGWCYGKRGFGFATLLGADGKMIGEEVGDKLCAGLLGAMPGLGLWENWVEEYVDGHHGIYSLGGRWCDLSAEMETGEDWQIRRAYRRALNFPCQATGADIIGDAMARIDACEELRALGYRVVLQVHDELVLRGPLKNVERATELVRKHMTEATANGTKLLVPLQVSIGHGRDYYEAK